MFVGFTVNLQSRHNPSFAMFYSFYQLESLKQVGNQQKTVIHRAIGFVSSFTLGYMVMNCH